MKGTYNNQNRKSGGYPKTKIAVSKKVGGQSLPCDEQRHSDCDGYLTFFPHLKGYACQCDCHKKAKVTPKVEPTVGGWDKTHKPVIEAMKKIGYGLLKDGETFYQIGYELEPRQGITFTMSQAYVITHSVQEANREMLELIGTIEKTNQIMEKGRLKSLHEGFKKAVQEAKAEERARWAKEIVEDFDFLLTHYITDDGWVETDSIRGGVNLEDIHYLIDAKYKKEYDLSTLNTKEGV